MNTTDIIAIGIFAVTGIMVVLGIRSWFPKLITPQSKASSSVMTTAGTTTSSPAIGTTSSASVTAPAVSASPRSWSWLWWIPVIAIVAFGGWWAVKTLPKNVAVPSPHRMCVPKKQLRQKVVPCSLRFVGGDGIIRRNGLVGIRKGGQAFFATNTLPWRKDAVFHVVVKIIQKTTGHICLEINGGRGGTKFYMHPGSPELATIVFFETGERGDPSLFNPGTNQIKIWSPGDDMIIQCVSIEMFYRD